MNLDRMPNHSARNIIELHFLTSFSFVSFVSFVVPLFFLEDRPNVLMLSGCYFNSSSWHYIAIRGPRGDLRRSLLELRQRTGSDREKIALDFSKPFKLG